MSVLIANGWVLTLDEGDRSYRPGYVWIEDDRIREVGDDLRRGAELSQRGAEVIEADGMAVMPGLINAHTHLFQTFMRGLADDKPLMEWLREEVWPFSLAMTEEDFYLAAMIGCLENLKNGATSVIDQHYIYTSKSNADRVAEAMEATGIRGTLCRCFADTEYHPDLTEDGETVLKELERVWGRWHGASGGRISVSAGPLNPWGCTPELFRETFQFARERGLSFQIHTAETRRVVERTLEKYGCRNAEFLADLGVLDSNTQLVHSVWLSDGEIELVRDSGASVVHCPVANMYLASGVAPVPRLLERGVNVCLATDGPGSNNSQDMLEVLKFTACLHKVQTLDSTVLSNGQLLRMATANGARAMGRQDLGVLKPGAKADVIVVNLRKPHISPVHRAESALIYNANGNDVETVLVDGKVVVREKKAVLVDEDALIEKCQQRIRELRGKVRK